MGLIDSVSSAFAPDTESADAGEQSDGAYWCDDCNVRVRDVDVASEGLDVSEGGTPECPECGESMRFEKSHADGCAC
jgi:hypothetical protein